jgi:hypothetical protein
MGSWTYNSLERYYDDRAMYRHLKTAVNQTSNTNVGIDELLLSVSKQIVGDWDEKDVTTDDTGEELDGNENNREAEEEGVSDTVDGRQRQRSKAFKTYKKKEVVVKDLACGKIPISIVSFENGTTFGIMIQEKWADPISMVKVAPTSYFGETCGARYFQWNAMDDTNMPAPTKVYGDLTASHYCVLLPLIPRSIGGKEKTGNEMCLITSEWEEMLEDRSIQEWEEMLEDRSIQRSRVNGA